MLQAASAACPPGVAPTANGSAPAAPLGVPAPCLAKEAGYNAIGVGAWELHDYIDFSSWFRNALLAVRKPMQHTLHFGDYGS